MAQIKVIMSDARKMRAADGEESVRVLAKMNELGQALFGIGETEKALTLFQSLHAKKERVSGKLHPETLGSLANQGSCLAALQRSDEAMAIFRECRERYWEMGLHGASS